MLPKWAHRALSYVGLAGDVHFLYTFGGSGFVTPILTWLFDAAASPPLVITILSGIGLFFLLTGVSSRVVAGLSGQTGKNEIVFERPEHWMDDLKPLATDAELTKPVIQDRTVYISDLARRLGGEKIISDRTFVKCDLVGPAVIVGQNSVNVNSTFMTEIGAELEDLTLTTDRRAVPAGAIVFRRVHVRDSRLFHIGFLARQDELEGLRENFRKNVKLVTDAG